MDRGFAYPLSDSNNLDLVLCKYVRIYTKQTCDFWHKRRVLAERIAPLLCCDGREPDSKCPAHVCHGRSTVYPLSPFKLLPGGFNAFDKLFCAQNMEL